MAAGAPHTKQGPRRSSDVPPTQQRMVEGHRTLWRLGRTQRPRGHGLRHSGPVGAARCSEGFARSCSTWRAAADLRQPRHQPPRLGRLARGRDWADGSGQAVLCRQRGGLRRAGSSLVPGSFGLRRALDGRCLGPSGRDGRFLGQPLPLGAQESRSDATVVGRCGRHEASQRGGTPMARPSGLAGVWPCPPPAGSGWTGASSVAEAPSCAGCGGGGTRSGRSWWSDDRVLAPDRSRAAQRPLGATAQIEVTSSTSSRPSESNTPAWSLTSTSPARTRAERVSSTMRSASMP